MRRVAAGLVALLAVAPVRAGADEFLALQSSAPGLVNYARLADIQAFLDASPTRCSVFLTNGQEIKAFQTCASIIMRLDRRGLVALPGYFGAVMLIPGFVTSLIAITNGGCRLNMRYGSLWVPVKQSCGEALKALAQEKGQEKGQE